MPCSLSILATVSLLISYPRLLTASRIFVYSQRSFSISIFNTSSTISSFVEGRPILRVLLESYILATKVRNHRSSVYLLSDDRTTVYRPDTVGFYTGLWSAECCDIRWSE